MIPITDHDRDTLAALVARLPHHDQERWQGILAGLLQRIDHGFRLPDWQARVERAGREGGGL